MKNYKLNVSVSLGQSKTQVIRLRSNAEHPVLKIGIVIIIGLYLDALVRA